MSEPMTIRARVAAPVKEVRQALTDPAAMRVWLAEHAEVDLPERYAFWDVRRRRATRRTSGRCTRTSVRSASPGCSTARRRPPS
ncbi:hypothetical protein SAMN05421874_1326 [Nonomuraea maritima]|uniref:Activator of Hsp90 ATPase homolog 1-like protein n=1 Tax=Nonomuraea maritima TaxID=683260 RepID=A0A1G9NRL1_9ACTN|nr:hypothetical protein [Nonomuraea maritima]SDL89246.1 hypothetical protein SAMN05421874_1326 [Nonomuraea maritima]